MITKNLLSHFLDLIVIPPLCIIVGRFVWGSGLLFITRRDPKLWGLEQVYVGGRLAHLSIKQHHSFFLHAMLELLEKVFARRRWLFLLSILLTTPPFGKVQRARHKAHLVELSRGREQIPTQNPP